MIAVAGMGWFGAARFRGKAGFSLVWLGAVRC